MISHQLVEISTNLILTAIQSDIAAALAQVNQDRTTLNIQSGIAVPTPREYLVYEKAQNYNAPSIYVICRGIDFKKDRGANHLNSTMDFGVSVLVEDQREYQVVVAAWRYQAALSKILDQRILTDTDANVRIVCIARSAAFSETFSNADTGRQGVFRKESLIDFDVESYEPL